MTGSTGSTLGRHLPPQMIIVGSRVWIEFRDTGDIVQGRVARADLDDAGYVIVETTGKGYFVAKKDDADPPFRQIQNPATDLTRRKFDAVLNMPVQTTLVECRAWATDIRIGGEEVLVCTVVRWDEGSDRVILLKVHNGDILIAGVDCMYLPYNEREDPNPSQRI